MNTSSSDAVNAAFEPMGGTATEWRPETFQQSHQLPLIEAKDAAPILRDLDLWDCWPLQHEDGRTVMHDGSAFWFFLSAEKFSDPGQRHLAAKLRLVRHTGETWTDCGPALPESSGLGHAEWAGSAVLHDDGKRVSLFYTASGSADGPGFQQRLVVAEGIMGPDGPGEWSATREILRADNVNYVTVDSASGEPGTIKAFRDPAWFRDQQTGIAHLLFTGSAAWSDNDFNGLIGLASLAEGAWQLERPLVTAIGVNNELERPHIVMRDGRYYLFWSTQRFTFSPETEAGPNGLYAMVADSLDGQWRPANGSGLVAANPVAEPSQCYSWWVSGEGKVWSFIDHWGMKGRTFQSHPELLRAQFGGTPAPRFRLKFDGDTVVPQF